jgi:hypothetical protein
VRENENKKRGGGWKRERRVRESEIKKIKRMGEGEGD